MSLLVFIPLLESSLGRGVVGIEVPHLGSVVRGAGGQVLDIGRQEDAIEVVVMGRESSDGDNEAFFLSLDHPPEVDISLEVNLM